MATERLSPPAPPGQVLLTLFAIVAERFPASNDGDEGGSAVPEELQAGADLSSALAALQGRGLADDATQQLTSLAAQHAVLCVQLQEVEAAATAARMAAQLRQRLASLDEALAAGRWAEAAEGGVALRDALASDPGSSSEALSAVEARLKPLQQRLLAAVPQLVCVDVATHLPAVAAPKGAAPADAAAGLLEVWRGLAAVGQLQAGLAALAELLLQSCVRPVLAEEAVAAGSGEGTAASPAGSLASTTLSRATARGDGRRSVERQLYKLLKAVCEQLLGGSAELAAVLGPLLWPELAAAYIALQLKPARPASDEELDAFSRRAALGVKLEGKAAKLGLLLAAGGGTAPGSPAAATAAAGPITRYVERIVGRFLSAKRARFIQAARDLLASATAAQETAAVGVAPPPGRTPRTAAASRSLFGGGPSASAGSGLEGEPSPLASGEYLVSNAAAGVVTLMREALAEACRSGSAALAQVTRVSEQGGMATWCGGSDQCAVCRNLAPPPQPNPGPYSGSLAQAMCGAVVDVSATLLALQHGGGRGGEAEAGKVALLPYPAALRHNDLFYIHQASQREGDAVCACRGGRSMHY